ncbi:MAG: hypothetical protein ABJB86_08055 [Bacteroidota bacterium]
MKCRLYILIGVVSFGLLNNGCKKSAIGSANIASSSITGKWTYAEYYFSIGGPANWQPVITSNQFIELKADGTFSSNLSPFTSVLYYGLVDSNHIKFNKQPGQDALLYFYTLDLVKHTLTLSDAINICIEGCAQKFKRS